MLFYLRHYFICCNWEEFFCSVSYPGYPDFCPTALPYSRSITRGYLLELKKSLTAHLCVCIYMHFFGNGVCSVYQILEGVYDIKKVQIVNYLCLLNFSQAFSDQGFILVFKWLLLLAPWPCLAHTPITGHTWWFYSEFLILSHTLS